MILLSWAGGAETRARPFIIGSKKAGVADVLLDDEYVSNLHAGVTVADGAWWVTDLGSTNGTYRVIGGTMPPAGRLLGAVRLAKGDKLRIGRTIVTFVPDEVVS